MTRFTSIAIGLVALSVGDAAGAADCQVNAKRCGDDGFVQICTEVAGATYWTTQEYKCSRNGEITDPPFVPCMENYRRCGDDGYEEICLADSGTFKWFRMKPDAYCRD